MKRKFFVGALLASCLLIGGTLVGCTTDSGEDEPTQDDGTQDGDETPSQDGDTTPGTAEEEKTPTISLSSATTTLYIDDVITITSTINNVDEGEVIYTIESGDDVISISENGEATALTTGTATIRGTLDGYDDIYDEITFTVTEFEDEHLETFYKALKSFDLETGVTIEGELELDLGTVNAGTYLTNHDMVLTIPLDATFGYTSSDDMIAKISIVMDDIQGTSITLENVSIDFAGFQITTNVTVDILDVIKTTLFSYIFTDLSSDELKDIEVINFYSDGSSNAYVELQAKNSNGGALYTMEFYELDLGDASTLFSSVDLFPQTKDLVSRGNIATIFNLLGEVTNKTSTEDAMTLTLDETVLELLNALYASLEFSLDFDLEYDLSDYGADNVEFEGITIPTEFTELSLNINNDAEDDLKFNNIVLSVYGKTESTEADKFLTLTVDRPEQLEDESTVSSLKSYLSTLIDTYLE